MIVVRSDTSWNSLASAWGERVALVSDKIEGNLYQKMHRLREMGYTAQINPGNDGYGDNAGYEHLLSVTYAFWGRRGMVSIDYQWFDFEVA